MIMLIVFTRSIIIYLFLLVTMRLMGKKQLGELQPFEFAISLIAAELACIPMSDTQVPIAYGLVPIFTLFVVEFIITKIVKHSIKLRKLINGKPVIVINQNGIDYKSMSRLDLTIHDILEAIRNKDYTSPSEIEYAIIETNGQMSIIPKSHSRPVTLDDIDLIKPQPLLPYSIICEGKLMQNNLDNLGIEKQRIMNLLEKNKLKQKDVLLLTVDSNHNFYLQPINKVYSQGNLNEAME